MLFYDKGDSNSKLLCKYLHWRLRWAIPTPKPTPLPEGTCSGAINSFVYIISNENFALEQLAKIEEDKPETTNWKAKIYKNMLKLLPMSSICEIGTRDCSFLYALLWLWLSFGFSFWNNIFNKNVTEWICVFICLHFVLLILYYVFCITNCKRNKQIRI